MKSFAYARAASLGDVQELLAADPHARCIAGGTNLVDSMRIGVERPTTVVDINALPLHDITVTTDRIEIGALARMSDVADHPAVRSAAPALAQALDLSASPQIRNMASMGGNLLQRTRCMYFRDLQTACNKRRSGDGCSAREGLNRMHAILGASPACIAVHPSDLAVALATLDAAILVDGARGRRAIPADGFHCLPGDTPERETVLEHGEVVVGISVPRSPLTACSTYLKVRDRASFEFALVSVAAALEFDAGTIVRARIALGGVAHKPWRSHEAEEALLQRSASDETFQAAASAALRGARGYGHNDFKIPLARNAIVRALSCVAPKT